MAEQAGGGAGEQVPSSGSRRPAIPGLGLVRRPRVSLASSHPGGVGAPPGGITAFCQELADSGARAPQKARPDAVRKTPQQSAERRAGLRHWPVISGDPEMELSRGSSSGAAFRTSACRRSAPLIFFGSRKWTRAPGAPFDPGGEALAV
jgi:hypothetical protein